MDAVTMSKLSLEQIAEISSLRVRQPDVDSETLAHLWADGIFNGRSLDVRNLVKAIKLMGPVAIDRGGQMWFYKHGVWMPDGKRELTRRVELSTAGRYRKDHVAQAESLIQAMTPQILGLGPKNLINVKNGMLNWETLELLPHDPAYFSTYQLRVPWNSEATCPSVEKWFDETFDRTLHEVLWQVVGVLIYPGMGFQKAIVLLGSGYNGKGTLQRLCTALLPSTAYTAIDPRDLATNRFKPAELLGKTANICGDIERFTFNSTAEIKKITGDDPINAERKNGHPFTFISQATMMFSANKMPPSRDMSHGWFRRWLIIPLERKISGPPDPNLEDTLHGELEGVLVRAVHALRKAMAQGGFDEPVLVKEALREYEYSCNSVVLFINEKITFGPEFAVPVSRKLIYDTYKHFCRDERLEVESKNRFYETLREMGTPHVREHWITRDDRDRGYVGIKCEGVWSSNSI